MYKRVLVPLDGSTTAWQVVPYATMIAKATGAKVALIRAMNGYPRELVKQVSHEFVDGQPSYPPSLQSWESVQDRIRDEVKQGLEEAAATIRAEGVLVDTIVAQNEPAEAIVVEAEQA